MATTKSTTRAKTKTAKKPVRKATAAKTTKKSVSAKVVRTAPKPSQTPSGLLGQLRALHIVSAVSGALMSVALILLTKAHVVPVTMNFVTQNSLLSDDGAAFVPAERIWYEIDLRWLVVAMLAVFSVYSLLVLTRWRASYEKALSGRIYLWRWVEYGLVGALLVKVVAMLAGIESEFTLKLMFGSVLAGAGFAWLSERQNERAEKVRSAHALSALAFLFPWLVIAGSLWATSVYGAVRLPWFAYATAGLGLAAFLGAHINQWLQHRRAGSWADYAFVERNHVLGSLLVKVAFVAVLIVGLQK